MKQPDALTALPGIGPKLTEQLHRAGIDTPDALRETGAKEAWLRILAFDPSACINRLYALQGAVRGDGEKALDAKDKADLKAFVRDAKGQGK